MVPDMFSQSVFSARARRPISPSSFSFALDRLLEKTEYNIGMGKDISNDTQDYYTFADAYKKAIDYNVYVNKGEYAKAEQIVKDIDNTQFNNVLFKEVLEKVKNTYIFEF